MREARQFRHLDFIGQFTTNVRHVAGADNVVVDALLRIEELRSPLAYAALEESQRDDKELESYLQQQSGLKLEKLFLEWEYKPSVM